MRPYITPSVKVLTEIEDLAYLYIAMRKPEPLDFVPNFSAYADCL